MNSLDVLIIINRVAVSTSNLRFCHTVPFLTEACQSIRADLQAIRFSISDELYAVLISELRRAHWEQLTKIEEAE